jgi:hypothetical protein
MPVASHASTLPLGLPMAPRTRAGGLDGVRFRVLAIKGMRIATVETTFTRPPSRRRPTASM